MGHRYPSPRRFKINRSYDVTEIAKVADVHEHTVRNWLKKGLQPVDDRHPIYVVGSELRRFLAHMRERMKSPCQPDELFCLTCRKPQRPWEGLADFIASSPSARLSGFCPVCQRIMYKRVSINSLPLLRQRLQLNFHSSPEPQLRLEGGA